MAAVKPLVLVTGVSGFVGSHVAYQLLEAGYSVRGTVRSAKLETLRSTAGAHYPNLELAVVDDVATGDFTDALKGVGAIIHVASPLAGAGSPEEVLKGSIEGTLNVLRQAQSNGVTKIVLTSSWGTTADPSFKDVYTGKTWNENSWGEATREEATRPGRSPLWTYLASKIFAEREAWNFADAHPEIDLATIHPPFIYGPYAPHFPARGSGSAAGTNGFIGALITGPADRALPPQFPPFFCDVRDVARAHVAALKAPKISPGEEVRANRFLVSGGAFTWVEAVEYLRETRPELAARLPVVKAAAEKPEGTLGTIDTGRAARVLGIEEYVGWKKTLDDTVDALLEEEKKYAAL
ncbi:hypothetical protein PLICRDRAFT_145505 [Plicaturopsis crispa FD-325 SS-3]|nr:hypothetical protein PLICRDRAFT_145505 [Plicaturopsis crispa FD-325 SS-3]